MADKPSLFSRGKAEVVDFYNRAVDDTFASDSTKENTVNPSKPLYVAVKGHSRAIKPVIGVTGGVAAGVDFLTPQLPMLPTFVYGATGLALLTLTLLAVAPPLGRASLRAVNAPLDDGRPLWKRPVWQFSTALLFCLTMFGFASIAKADEGGALASQFAGIRSLQETMFKIQADTTDIKAGVNSANEKLDRIVENVDPDNPADKCPDIDCAIGNGASRKVIEKLLNKGQKLPDGFVLGGAFASLIKDQSPARFYIADIYSDRGKADMRMPVHPGFTPRPKDLGLIRAPGLRQLTDQEAFDSATACVWQTTGGFTFKQIAFIAGDKALVNHLNKQGVSDQVVKCEWEKTYGSSITGGFEISEKDFFKRGFAPAS